MKQGCFVTPITTNIQNYYYNYDIIYTAYIYWQLKYCKLHTQNRKLYYLSEDDKKNELRSRFAHVIICNKNEMRLHLEKKSVKLIIEIL